MTTFLCLVGLPGSGKSFHAKQLAEVYGAKIIESDEYRERLYGDPLIQGDNNKLFETIHSDILKYLAVGKSVVFDATNLSRKNRVSILQKINKMNVYKVCYLIATEKSICIAQNNMRERVVPESVVDRMWKNFEVPLYSEGWNEIEIIYNYDVDHYHIQDFFDIADKFDQKNYHHSMTLGEHCKAVAVYLAENHVDEHIWYAGLLHDCGKLYTQVFHNMKGEPSDIAHYYFHENCSAYESLFYLDDRTTSIKNLIFAVGLINYHMRPYMAKSDKAKNKLKETVGDDIYYFLQLLHEADKKAH